MLSIAELKQHLQLTHTTAFDTYLADLEAAAVDIIGEREGLYLGAQGPHTLTLDGNGLNKLWLPFPIADVESPTIVVLERMYAGSDPTTIVAADADGYSIDGSKLIRHGGSVWTRGYRYTITYPRGYAPGAAPERLYLKIRVLVAKWFTERANADDLLRRRRVRVG